MPALGTSNPQPGELVVLVGLQRAAQHNYAAATVLDAAADDSAGTGDRLAVRLLHGNPRESLPRLSVRRRNLVRCCSGPREERMQLLVRLVWEHQLELRVAAKFLLDQLSGELGLCLHIAAFFPPRETLALTSGYAMGAVVRDWSCVAPTPRFRSWDRPLKWRKMRQPAGADALTDSFARIDCAVISLGDGRYVVAGGCDDHPARARRFFSSAFLYDALTHAVEALPDMPHPRHGCGGCFLPQLGAAGKVCVCGGAYVNGPLGLPGSPSWAVHGCVVYDLATRAWAPMSDQVRPPTDYSWTFSRGLPSPMPSDWPADVTPRIAGPVGGRTVAFAPVGTVGAAALPPRDIEPPGGWNEFGAPPNMRQDANSFAESRNLVVLANGALWLCDGQGWLHSVPRPPPVLGHSAVASVEWGDFLVFSQGRESSSPGSCHVFAARWVIVPTGIRHGSPVTFNRLGREKTLFLWLDLGEVGCGGAERIGADLAIVHDRLYISGGVDESGGGGFNGSVVRWGGTYAALLAEQERVLRELVPRLHDPGFIPVLHHDNPWHCSEVSASTAPPWPFPAEFLESDEDGRERMARGEMRKVTAEVERALSSAGSLSRLGWTAVEGLEMPTAMHAHSAITVPLLPQTNWSQPVSESESE